MCLECEHKFLSLKFETGSLSPVYTGWPIQIDIWYDDISIPTLLCIGAVAGPGAFGPEYLLQLLCMGVLRVLLGGYCYAAGLSLFGWHGQLGPVTLDDVVCCIRVPTPQLPTPRCIGVESQSTLNNSKVRLPFTGSVVYIRCNAQPSASCCSNPVPVTQCRPVFPIEGFISRKILIQDAECQHKNNSRQCSPFVSTASWAPWAPFAGDYRLHSKVLARFSTMVVSYGHHPETLDHRS